MLSLRKAVGSLFIVGVSGTALTQIEMAWLRLLGPSGVILFRRNIETARQTHALLQDVVSVSNEAAFRCVDMEGGLVDRLRDLIAPMPSPAAVAAAGRKSLSLMHGRLIGQELALIGLNTTFAPVLDLALPASANVMRSRVAGRTAAAVIDYAAPFLRGLRRERILACGKHFPGLGGGALDSHAAMPEIERDWEQVWQEDLLPYRKLHRNLPLVMVSHGAYPRIHKSQGPASVSRFWITDVLRRRIGYRGLILSDDMEMGGILGQQSIEAASIAAIAAGTHLIEICKEPALILQAYEAVLAEAERSSSFRYLVKRAAAHVERQKRRLPRDNRMPTAPRPVDVDALRRRIEHFSLQVQKQIDKLEAKRKRLAR